MVSNKRPIVLMGILLLMLLVYLGRPYWSPLVFGAPPAGEPPLPGRNELRSLEVRREADGRWMASVDYFYTGEPVHAHVVFDLPREAGAASAPPYDVPGMGAKMLQRGAHRLSVELLRPFNNGAFATTRVVAVMRGRTLGELARRDVAQRIDWPDMQTWIVDRQFAGKSNEELLKRAVELIDSGSGSSLGEAKRLLERILGKDPKFDAAYVELARVAMKQNWGTEGLHQAESLLASARQIRPESVNAKILLGYVYTHQSRYKEAEALFLDASKSPTPNLWLWADWGELLLMQGKLEPAALKYREAVTRPRTHDTYDRARLEAYERLISLLDQRKDLDGMEALHKQRAQEFGAASCYGADYARFLLQRRGDAAAAIGLTRQAIDAHCKSEEAREVLGLAHYVTWAGTTGAQRNESLNQARVYLPAGPRPLFLLATSERTAAVLRPLLATGEVIDQRDNDKYTALAYAMQQRDHAAARRLLRLGARTDAPVGSGEMPVALLPVIDGDIEGIRVMQQAGVDYAKLRYRGATAIEHAKSIGDSKLLDVLDRKGRTL